MASRYEELTGESRHIFRTTLIDAAWIIVQAVLETRPTAPISFSATDVIEVLPDVASRYYGYSGWCALNKAGDRSLANYDIWGYGLDETEEPSFINYGFYNSLTDEVIWHEID